MLTDAIRGFRTPGPWAMAAMLLCALGAPAGAWEVEQQGALPTFARNPDASAGSSSGAGWTDLAAVDPSLAASGYAFRTPDNFLIGFGGPSAWSLPSRLGEGLSGFGFNTSSIKFGYDLGQIRPFVT